MNVQTNRTKIVATSIVLVTLAVIALSVWWIMRQPSREDFTALRSTDLKAVTETQEKLIPALNTYLATFKKHMNETGPVAEAQTKSKSDHDAFKRLEHDSRRALDTVEDNKAVNDAELGETARQLVEVYTERIDYYAGIVDSYADVEALFGGKDNKVCMDIFVGETSSIADRKQRLSSATGNCYETIEKVKSSGNSTFRDYAHKLEKRVRLMESDAAVTAEGERQYQQFLSQKDKFEQEISAAEQRNASDEEYEDIKKRLEDVNRQIDDSQANFKYSGDRYIRTVKELSSQRQAIFETEIPEKLKYYKSLGDVRLNTLQLILDDKLAT